MKRVGAVVHEELAPHGETIGPATIPKESASADEPAREPRAADKREVR